MSGLGLSRLVWLGAVALFVSLSNGDDLDMGSLDQYAGRNVLLGPAHLVQTYRIANKRQKTPAGLTGSALWLSGQDGQGFDVVLSTDLQSQIQGVFDASCQDEGDQCYQAVRNTIRSADVELDGAIDKRDFSALLSKTFKKFGGFFTEVSLILYAMWKMKQPSQPHFDFSNHYIPQEQASSASVVGTSPVTVSVGGSPVVTITPTPDPTSGSATPALTTIATATESYLPGDVIINLDPGLAGRIGDIMGMMSDCTEGNTFTSSKRIRASGLGAAICGTAAVLQQAAPGGPFDDLRLLAPGGPALQFNGRDIVRAAGVALQIGRDLAPALDIPTELIDQLTMMIFALAVDRFVDNVVLGASNWIHGSTLTSGTATDPTVTSTTSSCSSTTSKSCVASCTEYGVLEACETSCETHTADGCAAPSQGTVSATENPIVTVSTQLWTWEVINAPMPDPTTSETPTSIDCSKVTNVPGKCGTPGCAYVIASNLGPAALCSNDYCNCGGHVAPLMTTTVSGTMSKGCGYTTVPTCDDCNAATCDPATPSPTPTPTAPWFPTPTTSWYAVAYVYNKVQDWYEYHFYMGQGGQGLDTCGRFSGSIRAYTSPLVDPSDYDNIPFPPDMSLSNMAAPFNDCKYSPGSPGPGKLTCGDKTIECQKQKPDPVTQTCKPGDGGGFMTEEIVETLIVQCFWPS